MPMIIGNMFLRIFIGEKSEKISRKICTTYIYRAPKADMKVI